MKIVVPVKMVPDLVEELLIDPGGTKLDTTWLRHKLNEFDDHAIEQAILLKENHGGEVTVIAPDMDGADDALYTAAAKGADQLIKLTGDFEIGLNNHALARALAALIEPLEPDLLLTGVQAHNDLDGSLGPLLAALLEMPYLGYVAGLSLVNDRANVRKEYPGGLIAEMELGLPAVLGIQAAESPPRYVAFSRIRQAMQSVNITEHPIAALDPCGGLNVLRMYQPEVSARAQMLTGAPEEVAGKLVGLFRELDIL